MGEGDRKGALSDEMKKAEWPVVRERNGSWIVYQAREYLMPTTSAAGLFSTLIAMGTGVKKRGKRPACTAFVEAPVQQ